MFSTILYRKLYGLGCSSLLIVWLNAQFLISLQAQQLQENLPITNGIVNTIAIDSNTIYLGGLFSYVGPQTGPGVPVDLGSAETVDNFPQIRGGFIHTIISDNNGGWYIGGDFTHVGNYPINNLAHIIRIGGGFWVDRNWVSGPSEGTVYSLHVKDNLLFVGGVFINIGGDLSSGFAAVDVNTGELVPTWSSNHAGISGGIVFTILTDDSYVFIGGNFDSSNGDKLLRFNISDGSLVAWPPQVNVDGEIQAMAIKSNTLYLGGQFTQIGDSSRNCLAAIDLVSNQPNNWQPHVFGINSKINSLLIEDNYIYVGGLFSKIGPTEDDALERLNLARIPLNSNLPEVWSPSTDGEIKEIVVGDDVVYVGGEFTKVNGNPKGNTAAVFKSSGELSSIWLTNTGKPVNALSISDDKIYIGGEFNSVGGQNRNLIASINASTGKILEWDPLIKSITGIELIRSIAIYKDTIYIGGRFSQVGEEVRNNIASLDRFTAQVNAWNPNVTGESSLSDVRTIAINESTGVIYLGGNFDKVGLFERKNIAAVNSYTGIATAWNPAANDRVWTIYPYNSMVFVGGEFENIGGRNISQFAAIDKNSGQALQDWDLNIVGAAVRTIDVFSNMLFIGGQFDNTSGINRKNAAAFNIYTKNLINSWDLELNVGSKRVNKLLIDNQKLFIGGSFESIKGFNRKDFGVVDIHTATLEGLDLEIGDNITEINTLDRNETTLYIGGGYNSIKGKSRYNFAGYNLYPPIHIESIEPPSNTVASSIEIEGSNLLETGEIFFNEVEATSFSVIDNTKIRVVIPEGATNGTVRLISPLGTAVYNNFKVKLTAPSDLYAEATEEGAIELSWVDNSNEFTGEENGFAIEQVEQSTGSVQEYSAEANVTYFLTENLVSGLTYVYRVKALSGPNYIDSDFSDKIGAVPFMGSVVTGLAKVLPPKNLKIYPNPANEIINLELSCPEKDKLSKILIVNIYDLNGHKVYNNTYGSFEKPHVNISYLSSGIYILRIHLNDTIISRKLVKD